MTLALRVYPFSYFLNMGQPRPLFHLFSSFQTNITIFTTNKCEKSPSSMWHRDLNPWHLEHEPPPITTRPGLPPYPTGEAPVATHSTSSNNFLFTFWFLFFDKVLFGTEVRSQMMIMSNLLLLYYLPTSYLWSE